MLEAFLTILAWIFAPLCTLMCLACIIGRYEYNKDSLLQLQDRLQGVTRVYPIFRWFVIALVFWALLIASYSV